VSRDVTWRDAGLRSPLLRALNAAGRALEPLGLRLPSLEPESLVEAARRQTGMQDFGPPDWREALEVLCASMDREARLSTFGRMALRGLVTGALVNRLKLIDYAARHPEVRQERIERPFVVVGLPRTGTTLLSMLLGLDPGARPLMQWETDSPTPPPDLASHAEDPRIAASAARMRQLESLNPAIRAMHPMGATLPTECVALFLLDLRSLAIETQALLPSYGHWLESCDMQSTYALHRLALQVLQSRIPTPTWSLKTPHHLWCLENLLATYPDARIVWTHRDPVAVVTSTASLNTAMQRATSREVDPRAVGAAWADKLHLAVTRGLDFDRDHAQKSWCHHLQYSELMADPIAAVRALYAHFGEEPGALHVRRMQVWMRERPQNAFGRHRYDPADFGFRAEDLRERFSAYRSRFDVANE